MSDSLTRLLRSPGAGGIDGSLPSVPRDVAHSPPPAPGTGLRPELRAIIDEFLSTVDLPLVLVDREFRLLAWNPSFTSIVGLAPESLCDRLVTDLLVDGGGDWFPRQLRADQGSRAGAQFGRVALAVDPGAEMLITGSQFLDRGVHGKSVV